MHKSGRTALIWPKNATLTSDPPCPFGRLEVLATSSGFPRDSSAAGACCLRVEGVYNGWRRAGMSRTVEDALNRHDD
jgi:hypothetical protein